MDEISFDSRILDWHQSQGGFGGDPSAHACRLLREVVELCVAAGASYFDIQMAVFEEIQKANRRGEWSTAHPRMEFMLEEYADSRILLGLFRSYFLGSEESEKALEKKFGACRERQWEVDQSGVLWRPGRGPGANSAIGTRDPGKSS